MNASNKPLTWAVDFSQPHEIQKNVFQFVDPHSNRCLSLPQCASLNPGEAYAMGIMYSPGKI